MVQSEWLPVLSSGRASLWERLVEAIETDISSGILTAGDRLPPHRDLAHRMQLAVGTASRAYAEAERRGLVESRVGRGTFVAARQPVQLAHRMTGDRINLGMNVPPVSAAIDVARDTLASLAQRGDLAAIFDYTFTAGLPVVRQAAERWLREFGYVKRASADRIIQTNGGQHALMLACSSLARAGDTVLCDSATYPGNRTIASYGGWHLCGVPADSRGMDPEALDRAAAETGARAVILIPTLQNPTTITLDRERRAELVAVARDRDLIIVEDDIYRVFGREDDPSPLYDIAPERVILVTSLSKALSPGLRLGFILAPENDEVLERLLLGAQATGYCPPAASGLILADWLENGTAARILASVRTEMALRNELAQIILADAIAPGGSPLSLHAWLPMSADRAGQVYEDALREGVELTPPDAPFIDPAGINGLRVCLGTPLETATLERALHVVKAALSEGRLANRRGIV